MTLRFPLRGPRLDLRPFTADDAAAAHRVYGDPATQLHERHDASDFDTRTQDKLAP